MRNRLYQIIEKDNTNDKLSLFFDYFIVLLIVLNILSIMLESFASIKLAIGNYLGVFEIVSVIVFSIEYLFRLITSDYKYPSKSKFWAIIYYIVSPLALIDLASILPFYLPFTGMDLRFLRIFRLLRILRIIKLNRYFKDLNLIFLVIQKKNKQLISVLFIFSFLLIISSISMYYIENPRQPDVFSNILTSLYWAIVTLTTVGYGDIYPLSFMGRLIASITTILGVGIVALPTAILSSGLLEEISNDEDKCSKCEYYKEYISRTEGGSNED